MSPAEILEAMGKGGFAIIQFVIIWFLWRELIRSRRECEGTLSKLQETQMRNVSKIARLEAQVELVILSRNDLKTEKSVVPQPNAGGA